MRQTAAEYADRLGRLNSNTIPIHLAEYYFYLGDVEQGFAMVRKYGDDMKRATRPSGRARRGSPVCWSPGTRKTWEPLR